MSGRALLKILKIAPTTNTRTSIMATYFSDFFQIESETLDRYGAFNISLITDLPLFVDPFLLFNSKKKKYQELHREVIRYLTFLRDKALDGPVPLGLRDAWYRFPEVRQNWLGLTLTGNRGSGLGTGFANALSENLNSLFAEFGKETITHGSHLEKFCLIREGVGRDNISDFTTNLIKAFLCEYTETFARTHIEPKSRRSIAVAKARFNYKTESWESAAYELPWVAGDYVILTPKDILTKDDTWINKADLVDDLPEIALALPDGELRAQVNNYFRRVLQHRPNKAPTKKETAEAARRTILKFPTLIDHFIRFKEDRGDHATSISVKKVRESEQMFISQVQSLHELLDKETAFYRLAPDGYEESHRRLAFLKDVIENKGGHRVFYNSKGCPIEREADLHIMYRLVWYGTPFDVSTEVNDGRGPADFKISLGAADKTIVEFKLAKNRALERNLKRQAEIYQKASDARAAIKAIVYFNDAELERVIAILARLRLTGHRDVVLIDGSRNKPSGSRA